MPEHQNTVSLEHVLPDLQHRLLKLEGLPPRVMFLENVASQIQRDYADLNRKIDQSRAETATDLKEFSRKLKAHEDRNTDALTSIQSTLGELGRKVTFASGAVWACGILGGAVFAFRDELIIAVRHILGVA